MPSTERAYPTPSEPHGAADLLAPLALNYKDLKWMVNAPTHIMNEQTVQIWDRVLDMLAKRMGEIIAARHVIEHKLVHIRKARVEQNIKRER